MAMREVPEANPLRVYEYGEAVAKKLSADDKVKREAHVSSGSISGGKLGQPTLWAVLQMIGVPREFDPYLLGKFMRGNDVEARAIEMLTNIPMEAQDAIEGQQVAAKNGAIEGLLTLQAKQGYRGGTGYIDLKQVDPINGITMHEIKSSTKMAYDKVAASGRSSKGISAPYYHHALQVAYYALGAEEETGKPAYAVLHYLNADDYRLCSFELNVNDYREEIDKEIDDIELAFAEKMLPVFEPFLDYHKAYKKGTYDEFNNLDPEAMMNLLESKYPEAYKRFMEA